MVVAGGYHNGDYLDTTEIYFYNSDELWRTLEAKEAKLPTPRMVTGGMVGGITEKGGNDYVYLFGKFRKRKWFSLSIIDCLFISGGSGKGGVDYYEILAYRTNDDEWNHFANMSTPDYGFALSEVDFKDFQAWCENL